jgi:hypothetical protein
VIQKLQKEREQVIALIIIRPFGFGGREGGGGMQNLRMFYEWLNGLWVSGHMWLFERFRFYDFRGERQCEP